MYFFFLFVSLSLLLFMLDCEFCHLKGCIAKMVFVLIINTTLHGSFLKKKKKGTFNYSSQPNNFHTDSYKTDKSACIYCLFLGGKGKDS